jgi:hypothetical protein
MIVCDRANALSSGNKLKLINTLHKAPESAFGRMAHGSIRIQEGEPNFSAPCWRGHPAERVLLFSIEHAAPPGLTDI